MRGKRGDVNDYFTALIIIFFLAVSFLVAVYAVDNMKAVITDTDINTTTISSDITDHMDIITQTTVDRVFAVIVGFILIGMLVSAFLIRIHPVFLFVYIIFLGVALFIAAPLANAYQSIISVEALSSIGAQQTMTMWIMEHLVWVLLGMGALSMIVTFSKLFGSGGYQASGDIG